MTDGPSVEADISQYYQQNYPGEVQVIGADLWNGTTNQLATFQSITGATFPLLLQGAATAGGNLSTLYGPYDNYVVINKSGIVRYHAALTWPHGNRYHLDEIRAAIDSLVVPVLAVPPIGAIGLRLEAHPNPFRGAAEFEWSAPGVSGPARLDIFDLTGRHVRSLAPSGTSGGTQRASWDGRDARGEELPAGVYLVRAAVGDRVQLKRVVRLL